MKMNYEKNKTLNSRLAMMYLMFFAIIYTIGLLAIDDRYKFLIIILGLLIWTGLFFVYSCMEMIKCEIIENIETLKSRIDYLEDDFENQKIAIKSLDADFEDVRGKLYD